MHIKQEFKSFNDSEKYYISKISMAEDFTDKNLVHENSLH